MKENNQLEILNEFFSDYSEQLNAKLFIGRFAQNFSDIILRYSPSGKIAFVSFFDSFNKYAEKINVIAKKCGIENVNVILNEDEVNDVDKISGLFNLPEDVRLVVFTDSKLSSVVSYFASIRGIPLLHIFTAIVSESLFPKKINLKNSCKADAYSVSPQRLILIDSSLITEEAEGYVNIISKITALYDYRINVSVNDGGNDIAYNMAKNVILETFSSASKGVKENLIFGSVKLAIANFLSNGKIFESSAINSLKYLLSEQTFESEFCAFVCLLCIYSSYSLTFTGNFIDYNKNAEDLCDITGIEEEYFLKNYLVQAKKLKNKRKQIGKVAVKIFNEAKENLKVLSKIIKTYETFGGDLKSLPFNQVKKLLKYSGDVGEINGMTVLRENGLIALI